MKLILTIVLLALCIGCQKSREHTFGEPYEFKPNFPDIHNALTQFARKHRLPLMMSPDKPFVDKLRTTGLLNSCPNEHTDLVDVPVIGGFAVTKELQKEVRNFKRGSGGCTRSSGIVIRCKQCRMTFDPARMDWDSINKSGKEANNLMHGTRKRARD